MLFNMINKVTVYDVGAANFLPEHFPLDKRFNYFHFEPDERGINKLKSWLKNKKPESQHMFFQQAIGESSKKASLALAEKNTASSIVDSDYDGNQIEIKISSLIDIINEYDLQVPNIIKIDVEGYELNVLKGIDLKNESLKVIEVEVTLGAETLSGVISLLADNNFKIAKLRTHGNQDYNPRNWLRGKIHGLTRKLKIGNYGVIKSEDSWSKPTTPLTQIELVFLRDIDFFSQDPIDAAICDIFGLALRKEKSGRLKCGERSVDIFNNLTLIR